ncbi:MAG TPA: MmcQ/YjbR family DNA-binding protein [Bryobacteraceae bacterium]|nr:MmcQ/YjbR family DNA-binding protein [Bryobacteraceae bacterium]
MTREAIRAFCLQMPHVTERFQFHHSAFQIGGKTFAMLNLEVEGLPLCFKCTPEDYAEAIEMEGVVPAPYMAHNHWAALVEFDSLPAAELKERLRKSRELLILKLPKKTQAQLK